MFSYYGSKSKIVDYYPPPKHKRIIEPFAGSARYSLKYWQNDVLLVDKYPVIVEVWSYLKNASEADILNVALFGMTAKEWREQNKDEKGNIRDTANVKELVCLANMESLNAHFINEGLSQKDRLQKLNKIAIEQMKILSREYVRKLEKVR